MKKVLFVCLGNICRSPMAEAVFKDYLDNLGRSDDFLIKSCGMGSWHIGNNADPRTLDCLSKNGIEFKHVAAQIGVDDFENYDFLVAMDGRNFRELQDMIPESKPHLQEKIILYRSLNKENYQEVPDPYYGGEEGFQEVYDIIKEGCGPLLNYFDKKSKPTGLEHKNL